MISVHSNQTLLSKSNKFLQGMSTLFTEHNSCWISNSLCGFTTAGLALTKLKHMTIVCVTAFQIKLFKENLKTIDPYVNATKEESGICSITLSELWEAVNPGQNYIIGLLAYSQLELSRCFITTCLKAPIYNSNSEIQCSGSLIEEHWNNSASVVLFGSGSLVI